MNTLQVSASAIAIARLFLINYDWDEILAAFPEQEDPYLLVAHSEQSDELELSWTEYTAACIELQAIGAIVLRESNGLGYEFVEIRRRCWIWEGLRQIGEWA